MNQRFQTFEQWYKDNICVWEKQGIFIDKVYQSDYANQYHIELYSVDGVARISLYEGNDTYWVDFEAGNAKVEDMFYRMDIKYNNPSDIMITNEEFIAYMSLE